MCFRSIWNCVFHQRKIQFQILDWLSSVGMLNHFSFSKSKARHPSYEFISSGMDLCRLLVTWQITLRDNSARTTTLGLCFWVKLDCNALRHLLFLQRKRFHTKQNDTVRESKVEFPLSHSTHFSLYFTFFIPLYEIHRLLLILLSWEIYISIWRWS